ncbi:hypothetical protein F4801DRAFT_58720 [Xylaria longipes]|nr:hypothetical protein F4801DRAFT_58720 [Xylaria longipes]
MAPWTPWKIICNLFVILRPCTQTLVTLALPCFPNKRDVPNTYGFACKMTRKYRGSSDGVLSEHKFWQRILYSKDRVLKRKEAQTRRDETQS